MLSGMKQYKPYHQDEPCLLPLNVREWLPEGHLALFISDVVDHLDLSAIRQVYEAANQHPDHDSIASFRQRHLQALAGLFLQVLRLCEQAGLVKLGRVALDGTKVKANASKHKAMSYERMGKTETRLEQEVADLLAQAQQADDGEDNRCCMFHRIDKNTANACLASLPPYQPTAQSSSRCGRSCAHL